MQGLVWRVAVFLGLCGRRDDGGVWKSMYGGGVNMLWRWQRGDGEAEKADAGFAQEWACGGKCDKSIC